MLQPSLSVPVGSNPVARSCDCLAHRFGNAGDLPDRRPRYPSDMTDAEWAVVREVFPVPAWMNGRGRQPEGYRHRQMLDAVRYLVAGGITWRSMPANFPAWGRVYAFARRWRLKGLLAELHDRLRGWSVRMPAGPQSRPRPSSTPSRCGPHPVFRAPAPAGTAESGWAGASGTSSSTASGYCWR